MNKKIIITLSSLAMLTLSGCSTTGSFSGEIECPVNSNSGCTIKGKAEIQWLMSAERNFILPIMEMIASATGFSYNDWVGLNVNDFSMEVTGTTATSSSATVKVYDQSGSLLGQSSFAVTKQLNVYKFTNPNSVKNWSTQFIDLAMEVEVELDVHRSADMTLAIKEKNNLKAYATHTSPPNDKGCCIDTIEK